MMNLNQLNCIMLRHYIYPASIGQYIIKPKNEGDELAILECYMDMGNAYK